MAVESALVELAVAAISVSPRGELTQDRVGVLSFEDSRSVGVIVCDGVGSLPESGEVAELVVAATCETAAACGSGQDQLAKLLHHADDVVRNALPDVVGATTALALVGRDEGILDWAWVGNGAVIEICAVMAQDRVARMLWVNHALPHMVVSGGMYALRSVIPSGPNVPLMVQTGSATPTST